MDGRDRSSNGLKVVQVDPTGTANPHEIAFEAFGLHLAVSGTPPEVLEHVRPFLPPGWKTCSPSAVKRRFAITADGVGTYEFWSDGRLQNEGLGLELAVLILDTELRLYIARKAPDAIFIHAGVVAHRGKAIVIPGMSFSGKTTLVAALVREGATYYSDEFAVLGNDGLVHPYPKLLSIRDQNRLQVEHHVDSLGGVAGEAALPMGAIVVTSYKPGAEWQPERVSGGEGGVALLANAVPARERPAEVMRAISRCADGATVIRSDRGDAEEVARWLLAELDGVFAAPSA
jgi:hypothetical protein